MPIDQQMIKGSVSIMLLSLLTHSDMYGYQMIQELAKISDNIFEFKEGTLYPVLQGLEKEGLVVSYWENTNLRRKRKYYTITDKGKKYLKKKRGEWSMITSAVNKVLEGVSYE